MNPKDLFRSIHEATLKVYGYSATRERNDRLKALADSVAEFRPDAFEAVEIVEALAAGLKVRHDDCTEVLLRMSLLKRDLERLDAGMQIDAADALAQYEAKVSKLNLKTP